jgi:hypothetical protein
MFLIFINTPLRLVVRTDRNVFRIVPTDEHARPAQALIVLEGIISRLLPPNLHSAECTENYIFPACEVES